MLEDLNDDQKRAADLIVMAQRNTFVTGGAGTGKSFCIATIVQMMRDQGRRVEVTATTGVAAISVGGVTIHYFAGFGLGNESKDEIRRKATSKRLMDVWTNVDVLIIDEISMLGVDYFEKLNYVAQQARQSNLPFGGLQVVAVGDFFQLPPVTKRSSLGKSSLPTHKEAPIFCFESPVWKQTFGDCVVELKQVFRQTDPRFVECLQRLRWGWKGGLDPMVMEDTRLLTSCLNKVVGKNGIKPTILHARTDEVNRINQQCLDAITAPPHEFHMVDGFEYPRTEAPDTLPPRSRIDRFIQEMRRTVPVDEKIILKTGTQVMLVCNLSVKDHGLANGSRGVVVGFRENEEPAYPIVRFSNKTVMIRAFMWKKVFRDKVYAYVAQIPLKLAYAHTIHKSQSQSLDAVEISLDQTIFEDGQAYTALSRVRSLDGLSLRAFHPSSIRANPRVISFYQAALDPQRLQRMLGPAFGVSAQVDDESSEEEEEEELEDEHMEEEEDDEVFNDDFVQAEQKKEEELLDS